MVPIAWGMALQGADAIDLAAISLIRERLGNPVIFRELTERVQLVRGLCIYGL